MSASRARRSSARNDLSPREWKIVEAMYRLMPEKPRTVTYEDIVVKAWQLHPDDFGLRGYSDKYPDASDIHKPLYNALKSRGWVRTGARGQKKFSLTSDGWERAHQSFAERALGLGASGRATRNTEQEFRHLERSAAAQMFMSGETNEILDTDFYAFYRTSVRADPAEFEGRLATVRRALDEALNTNIPGASVLDGVDRFLREQFSDVIDEKTERRRKES